MPSRVQTGGQSSGLLDVVVLAIGTALTLLALGVIQAGTARAAITMPFVALTIGYVYFDARVRSELTDERETAVLPEEVGLSFRFG